MTTKNIPSMKAHLLFIIWCLLSAVTNSSRKAALWVGLLFAAVYTCIPQTIEEGDKTISFKHYLDASFQEYEVVFSITQRFNESNSNALAELNKKMASNFEVIYDTPVYYRIRRARDGFYSQTASNVSEVLNQGLVANGRGVHGVVSNSFWSAQNSLVFVDNEKLKKLQMERGIVWQDLADQAVGRVLTLGLLVRRGTLAWDGLNFTGEAVMMPPVPKLERGKRVVIGKMKVDHGVPSQINYSIGSMQFEVEYNYEQKVAGPFNIPGGILIRSTLREGHADEIVLKIISLCLTNFPPNSTGPDNILDTEKQNSKIVNFAKGDAKMITQGGHAIQPIPVTVFGESREINTNTELRKWIVLSALVLISLLSYFIFRKRGVGP